MASRDFLLFHPERISWIGGSVLGAGLLLAVPFLSALWFGGCPIVAAEEKKHTEEKILPLSFSLTEKDFSPSLPLPDVQKEICFSFDPPRPDGMLNRPQLSVRLKKNGVFRRAFLPCRIDLEYRESSLTFSQGKSLFWMEIDPAAGGMIEVKVCVAQENGKGVETGRFFTEPEESPILSAQEIPACSPFRRLAEARWLGMDLFRKEQGQQSLGERIEIGESPSVEFIELKENEWLFCKDGKWEKVACPGEGNGKPIVHIQSNTGKQLVLEGWNNDAHMRFALPSLGNASFKIRGEDLFSSIRVRSEKQISCMLEKQCLVLRAGDWVAKTEGRWKVLRKESEREAYLTGKSVGEIFVFDQIALKQGQKFVQGRLFNTLHCQAAPIEIAAQSGHRPKKEIGKKGGAP
jgi:hypothetical protein